MTVDSNTLYFTYDASGTPQTVTYNGTTYFYATNLQGDITAILNTSGETVVSYTYDAWGNHTSGNNGTGTLASTLGRHNPLRYRGYVYDVGTGLYYLQSRFYSPYTGRFINADDYMATRQGLLGNNMFAYCLNSPSVAIDSNGKRTYFINGIHNQEEEEEPEYAKQFCVLLSEKGETTVAVPVYNNQKGLWGYVEGVVEVVLEMLNQYIYATRVAQYIQADLTQNPLDEGEKVNLVGYSGGGQIALNVAELLSGRIDNVVLIGTPVMEVWDCTTNVSMLYSWGDPLSWNVGFGYNSYCVGKYGHSGYFSDENIEDTINLICSILN